MVFFFQYQPPCVLRKPLKIPTQSLASQSIKIDENMFSFCISYFMKTCCNCCDISHFTFQNIFLNKNRFNKKTCRKQLFWCGQTSATSLKLVISALDLKSSVSSSDNSSTAVLKNLLLLPILFPEMRAIACARAGTHASKFTCAIYRTHEIVVFSCKETFFIEGFSIEHNQL